MAVAAELKKIFQELIVPELKEIKGDQKTLHVEISRLDQKIDAGFVQVNQKIDSGIVRLDEKIDAFRNEVRSEIRRVDEKIDSGLARLDEKIEIAMQIRERLAALESRVATLGH